MRVLLDEQLPLDLSVELRGHAVETVVSHGWAGIKNGELLARMRGQYNVLVRMDRGSEFQQQIGALPFGIVVVRARSNHIQERPLVSSIIAALDAIKPGLVRRVGA
jgi:hypothetical protein